MIWLSELSASDFESGLNYVDVQASSKLTNNSNFVLNKKAFLSVNYAGYEGRDIAQ